MKFISAFSRHLLLAERKLNIEPFKNGSLHCIRQKRSCGYFYEWNFYTISPTIYILHLSAIACKQIVLILGVKRKKWRFFAIIIEYGRDDGQLVAKFYHLIYTTN